MTTPADEAGSHSPTQAVWRVVAIAALVALVCWAIAWEARLAPLRPGGSWLILKGLPLLAILPGLLRGHRKAAQWGSLLVWLYVAEGLTRAVADIAAARACAIVELALAALLFAACVALARVRAPSPTRPHAP